MDAKLLEILLDLHRNKRSGVLRIERNLEKKQLILDTGLLAFAESNAPEDHLVRIMVERGILPQTKVKEITPLMKSGKTSEEAVFAASGLEAKEVEKGRLEQAVAIVASLLSWQGGTPHFYQGEKLVRYHVHLRLSMPELLVLSACRGVSERRIPAPPGFLQGTYTVAKDCAANALDFPLSKIEFFALSQLNEPVRLSDLALILPASEGKPEEVLLRLFALGFIEPYMPPESSAAQASSLLAESIEEMHARFEGAVLYEILSIPADANQADVQTAYHGLAKQYHPDRFQSDEFSAEIREKAQQLFTRINEAYITLKDPVLRAAYDKNRFSKEAESKTRGAGHLEEEKMAEALFRDARALLSKGDFEKATERLNECVYLRPEKAAYHYYLGVAQSEIPKLRKKAEQHLLKALDLDSTSVASRLELAKLYIKVLLRRKAESQLQEVLHWDPENQEAKSLLAQLKKS